MQACGLIPIGTASPDSITIGQDAIAADALRLCGINPGGPVTGNTGYTSTAMIASRILIKLGVVDPTETPNAADVVEAQTVVNEMFNVLYQYGINTWSLATIPSWAEQPMIEMGMAIVGSSFGKPQTENMYNDALFDLWRMSLSGLTGQTMADAAVLAVHERLLAMGYVNWSVAAIPTYAADSYSELVAAELLPVYTILRMQESADLAGAHQALIGTIQTAAESAMKTLRMIAYSGPQGVSLATEKLSAVHDGLSALGLVSWPLAAVPAAFADDYVAMANPLLAAVVIGPRDAFARQADKAAWDDATARIKRSADVAQAEELAEDRIATVHAELTAANLANWPVDEIPEPVADAYVQMSANSMSPSFGGAFDPKAYDMAMKRVRAVAMAGPAGQALAEQKVRAVHSDLDARGKVLWSLFDLPDYAEEPYVLMSAALLAPEMGMEDRPLWYQQGQASIFRQISLQTAGRSVAAVYY